jgi:integrase
MSKSEKNFYASEYIRYVPAVLHEQKNGDWRIVYYALHPQIKELTCVRVNKILKAYGKKADARRHIAEMIQHINAKLSGGWSPFFDGEDSRLYITLPDVTADFLEAKSRENRKETMRSYVSFCKMLNEWADKNAPKIYFSLFNHNYAIRFMDWNYVKKGVSNTTYNNLIKVGRALYNWATELVVNLVYSSLIRPNEIKQLKVADVHLDEKYIIVPSEKYHNSSVKNLNTNISLS